MTLAIFDLDNTLIAGDSDHSWGEFLCNKGYVDADHYRSTNDRFYDDYCRGELDIYAYQRFALEPLKGKTPAQMAERHAEFMREAIEPLWLPKAEALLQQHRDEGHFLLIITATNRFITEPIAHKLGVDDLIATDPELVDGIYTGEISGTPCYQHGKVERLEQWLKDNTHNLSGSYFYSDSHNDLPLLEQIDHPVAVDADEKLATVAREKGWKSISLRV